MALSSLGRSVLILLTIAWSVAYCFYGWTALSSVLIGHRTIRRSVSLTDFSANEWFILHPLLAVLGTVALPVPGIILRRYKGYWSNKFHAIFLGLSTLAVFLSVYVVFVNRSVRGKSHISSLHSFFGLMLFLGYILFTLVGVFAMDPDWAWLNHSSPLRAQLKAVHKVWGRPLLVMGYLVCLSGWYKFFQHNSEQMQNAVVVVVVAIVLTYIDMIIALIEEWRTKASMEPAKAYDLAPVSVAELPTEPETKRRTRSSKKKD